MPTTDGACAANACAWNGRSEAQRLVEVATKLVPEDREMLLNSAHKALKDL